jgi:hypothetical protein
MMLYQPHRMYCLEWQTISMHCELSRLIKLCPLSIYRIIPSLALIKAKINQRAKPKVGPSVSEIPVKYEHITDCANVLVHKYFYNENRWTLQTEQG